MSKLEVFIDEQRFLVEVKSPGAKLVTQMEVFVDGKLLVVTLPDLQQSLETWHWCEIDGRSFEMDIDPELGWIKSTDGLHRIEVRDLETSVIRPVSGDARVKAPIPGLVSKVFVEPGQLVRAGQRLLILEAMKMENEIVAPKDGVVSKLNAWVGKSVALGELIVAIE